LEVIVSICLLALPRYRVSALWISLVLLLLFTGAMSINLLRESSFGCGCFSSSPLAKPMSWMGLVRNGCLIALTALGLVSFRKSH
jgi:putative oxidoreductase